ncbi:nuclear transport factor 2 family protein [Actinoplanes sp. URMC 104]|uniref:nuclear transport factor 2 family protein n=1 Tax=Actinoplanes sp. URMC 104 TaxID=3423409 RepID=UPI003F1CFCCE
MDAVAAHIGRFNAAVTSGDWGPFVAALHPDAVMTFVGVPPFVGRDAIAAAYAANPPTDTMRVVTSDGERVVFEWTRGGTGVLTLGWADGRVAAMHIVFTS